MDHRRAVPAHEERRLLDGVVADRDDQIGPVDRPMHVVALRQRRRPHVEVGASRDGALAHLGVEERDARPAHEIRQRVDQPGAVAGGADHDQRALGRQDHVGGAVERGGVRHRPLDRMDRQDRGVGVLRRDVFRQFQMDRPRPFLHRHPEAVADDGGDRRGADDLARHLGQRLHGGDHVDDLETRLTRGHDRLLAGDHDHRHGAEVRIGRAGREVQRARPQRRDADAGPPGQPAICRGHEGCRLFVAGQYQFDARRAQRFHHIQVLLAGNAEDPVNPFVLQCRHQQVGAFSHRMSLH